MKIGIKAKQAILIGTLCSVAYLAVYIVRNILGAVTPAMLVEGNVDEAYIGKISSAFFIFYAVGQLINGVIGDKIKARYMISLGLLLAGITNFIFSRIVGTGTLDLFVYGVTGFFLAMIYGPMTKVVAENTEPIHATRCCLGYTFASLLGSPLAGLLATYMAWENVFFTGSAALAVMAAIVFGVFLVLERRGIVKYGQYRLQSKASTGEKPEKWLWLKVLLRRRIVLFALIAVITGIVRTSVVFWLPTYYTQALGFSAQEATTVFSVSTLVISLSAFIAIFIYERLHHNMDLTILIMFSCATVAFLGVYFVKQPFVNVALMVLGIMGSNAATTMLWSNYCPSLKDTGMVSGATGFLDFLSYMAAALANLLFSNAVGSIGWGNLILIWFGLMAFGVLISLPWRRAVAILQRYLISS